MMSSLRVVLSAGATSRHENSRAVLRTILLETAAAKSAASFRALADLLHLRPSPPDVAEKAKHAQKAP